MSVVALVTAVAGARLLLARQISHVYFCEKKRDPYAGKVPIASDAGCPILASEIYGMKRVKICRTIYTICWRGFFLNNSQI